MNSFAIEDKMCVDNDQNIYIPSILNVSHKKIDQEKNNNEEYHTNVTELT